MEARLYDLLFMSEDPNAIKGDWLADMNPESEVVVKGAMASPALAEAKVGDTFQLERLGYFCVDPDSKPDHLVRGESLPCSAPLLPQLAARPLDRSRLRRPPPFWRRADAAARHTCFFP